MRVSLVIDGDSSGGLKAVEDQSRAIADLGKQSDATAKAIEDGFNRATGVAEKLSTGSKALGAANDNAAGSALGVAQHLGDVAGKALGADNALAKVTAGAASLAKGFTDLVKGGVGIAAIPGAVGLAISAVTLFYSVANNGAETAAKRLDEQARLVGVVKSAYDTATGAASNFAAQSAAVTKFQLGQNLAGLQSDLQKAAQGIAASFNRNQFFAGVNTYAAPLAQEGTLKNYEALRTAVTGLQASIASGGADIRKYQDDIAAIGKAAEGSNPALAKLANEALNVSKPAADLKEKIDQVAAAQALANGTATEQQKKLLGISTAASDASNEYERLSKSLGKQAAAQEAEALTVGKSAGEAAKLRVAYLLNEAATQSGIKVTGEYAKEIDNLASRFGKAAQAAAEAGVKSNAAFDRGQLGRTSLEANVAGQLRNAYGDDIEGQLNGALASSIRFNESMRDLKSTTMDLGTSAWRDIRTEIEAGTNAADIFGKVSVNALVKIADKFAEKSLDKLISGVFGAFTGGGASSGIFGSIGKLFGFSEGGWTGPGGKHEAAGIVHRDEVVWSKADVNRHGGVAVVEAMRLGARGYTDGGVVGGAPSPLRSMRSVSSADASSAQSAGYALNFTYAPAIDARGADVAAVARLTAAREKDRKELERVIQSVVVKFFANNPGARL